MAFRDEQVAVQSRLEALELENRRLTEELATARGARTPRSRTKLTV